MISGAPRRSLFLLALLLAFVATSTGRSGAQTPTLENTIRLRIEQARQQPMVGVRGTRLLQPEAVARSSKRVRLCRPGDCPVRHSRHSPRYGTSSRTDSPRPTTISRRSPPPSSRLQEPVERHSRGPAGVDGRRRGCAHRSRPIWAGAASVSRQTLECRSASRHPGARRRAERARRRAGRRRGNRIAEAHTLHLCGPERGARANAQLAAAGGWPTVTAGAPIKPGATDPRVALIRRRLRITGELPAASALDDPAYGVDLQTAVKTFQAHHRLTDDGMIGKATIDAMNVSAEARAQQIRVNLERARWVVGGLTTRSCS